LQLVAAPKH